MPRSDIGKFFLGDDTTTVSIVERTEEPIGIFEGIKRTFKGAISGGIISAAISGTVGAVVSIFTGDSAQALTEALTNSGEVTVGGGMTLLGTAPSVTLDASSGVGEALASNPTLTTAALNAADGALNVGYSASIVGAGVGAIREGWADKITRERVLASQQTQQIG